MAGICRKERWLHSIHELVLEEQRATELDLTVRCSKGTYIRTLVEDIGERLGCGAYVSRLHRTHCGPFNEAQMFSLEQLEALAAQGQEALDAVLMHPSQAVPHWPQVELEAEEGQRMLHGQTINTSLGNQAQVQLWTLLSGVNTMIGIGQIDEGKIMARRLFQ